MEIIMFLLNIINIYLGGHEWFNNSFQGQNTSELIWNFVSKYNINGLIE